jgi:transposase
MSRKERGRKSVLDRVASGSLTLVESAEMLGLSYRQCKRVYARYRTEGDAGLLHRNRGKPSLRALPQALREQVLARYRERYLDFGPTFAAEKLAEDGFTVDHETLRRWLIAEGLWQRSRKRGPHRTRRPRKEHFGELVQFDGSHHAWFGAAHPSACLMNLVDDATGRTLATLDAQETTEAAMRTLWAWIERYGVPQTLYCDRKSVYITDREPSVEEQLAGEKPLTSFGKACKKIGIQIITAYSPQAKGRVERNHGVYQDRLCKELALRGITTIEGANEVLTNGFTGQLNEKFAQAPLSSTDYHQPLARGVNLAHVFCLEETRQVQNDWTIRFENQYFQISRDNKPLPKPKTKVTVRTLLDGSVHLLSGDRPLIYSVLTPAELKAAACAPKPEAKALPDQQGKKECHSQKPAHDHAWKKPWKQDTTAT